MKEDDFLRFKESLSIVFEMINDFEKRKLNSTFMPSVVTNHTTLENSNMQRVIETHQSFQNNSFGNSSKEEEKKQNFIQYLNMNGSGLMTPQANNQVNLLNGLQFGVNKSSEFVLESAHVHHNYNSVLNSATGGGGR